MTKLAAKKTPVKKNNELNGAETEFFDFVSKRIENELAKIKSEIKKLKIPKNLLFLIKLKFSNFGLYINLKNKNEKVTKKAANKI